MQSHDEPELGKVYEFGIEKVNELNSIGVLQVLFSLTEEGKDMDTDTDILYYVQNYTMDVREGSAFMELLAWCEEADVPHVFGYDTDELVGIWGTGTIILDECGEQQFKFIDTAESHWCEVEGFPYFHNIY